MDVNAPQDEAALFADGEVVWSSHPDADVKLAMMFTHRADDGGKKARFTRESTKKTVNHRAGNAVAFRLTCGDLSLCAFIFRTQGCGCGERPAFPAPSACWRDVWRELGQIMPRDRGSASKE
jgi:hypothetical protein